MFVCDAPFDTRGMHYWSLERCKATRIEFRKGTSAVYAGSFGGLITASRPHLAVACLKGQMWQRRRTNRFVLGASEHGAV